MRARIYKSGYEHEPVWEGDMIADDPGYFRLPDEAAGLLSSGQTYQWRYGETLPEAPRPRPGYEYGAALARQERMLRMRQVVMWAVEWSVYLLAGYGLLRLTERWF